MQRKVLAAVSLFALVLFPISALWFLRGQLADNSLQPGESLPPLTLTTIDGSPFQFEDFAGRKSALFFFSVECSHCRQEFANLRSLSEAFSKDLQIFFVSLSEEALTRIFLDTEQSQHPVFFYHPPGSRDRVTGPFMPLLYLIDGGRIIRQKHLGERSLQRDRTILTEYVLDPT